MKNLLHLTDLKLIRAFKDGNNQAFEVLLMRHKEKIFSSILFLVKDDCMAEDLFQDTFVKIIDFIRNERYNEQGRFLPWAIRIAHNLCIDHYRRVKRSPMHTNTEDGDIMDLLPIAQADAAQNIIRSQTERTVGEMLDLIPAEQREVIVLRHYADLSFKEIAELANCSINTALGRMRYGLINLRKLAAEKQMAF